MLLIIMSTMQMIFGVYWGWKTILPALVISLSVIKINFGNLKASLNPQSGSILTWM